MNPSRFGICLKKQERMQGDCVVVTNTTEATMPILLWLVGIPIPIIIIAYLLMHH